MHRRQILYVNTQFSFLGVGLSVTRLNWIDWVNAMTFLTTSAVSCGGTVHSESVFGPSWLMKSVFGPSRLTKCCPSLTSADQYPVPTL